MTREKLARIGFTVALAGMGIVALCLVPAFSDGQALPWPLALGSCVYILGSFCLAFNARGDTGKKAMVRLRFVRLGIIFVVIFLVQRMAVR